MSRHTYLDDVVGQSRLPGAMVAEIRGESVASLIVSGVSKVGETTPLDTNQPVHLGSCTKAMTAVLLGLLVDKGMITFESTIKDIFSSVIPTASNCLITIRQLLDHTSGVKENLDWNLLNGMFAYESSHQKIRSQRLEVVRIVLTDRSSIIKTGSYLYSNVGYVILGSIIEVLLDTTWEIAMTTFFNKIGITTGGFGAPTETWGHIEASFGSYQPRKGDNPAVMGPAGTVHCSIRDWAKFIIEIKKLTKYILSIDECDDESVTDRSKLGISLTTFRKLIDIKMPFKKYSGGWLTLERNLTSGFCLTHAGSNTMWYVNVWIVPYKDMAYLIAINAGGSAAANAANGIMVMLFTEKNITIDLPPKDVVNKNSKCTIQ